MKTSPEAIRFLRRLKKLIKEKGMKQYKLGEVLGVPATASLSAKSGKAYDFLNSKTAITVGHLQAVCKFFGKSARYFFEPRSDSR